MIKERIPSQLDTLKQIEETFNTMETALSLNDKNSVDLITKARFADMRGMFKRISEGLHRAYKEK